MKASELTIGKQYGITRNGATVPVILKEIKEYTPFTGRTVKRFICLNTITNRLITVKSAARFRSLVSRQCPHD
jgi:hypothetical protein